MSAFRFYPFMLPPFPSLGPGSPTQSSPGNAAPSTWISPWMVWMVPWGIEVIEATFTWGLFNHGFNHGFNYGFNHGFY